MAAIDYYLFPLSPFCYLAGFGLEEVAARQGASIAYKPVQLMRIFAETGTPQLKDRHVSRQRYRLQDIARVARAKGLPINLQPRYWPANPVPASTAIIAAQAAGGGNLGGAGARRPARGLGRGARHRRRRGDPRNARG